jgi:prepilin signal peptidase PulO-like enzyme (type II secretory pathway)
MVLGGGLGLAVGLVWRYRASTREFPFGPALAAALFTILLFPEIARVLV